MSEELKICFSSHSYIDYLTNTISEEVLKGYKNKIVFFRKDWNDYNFRELSSQVQQTLTYPISLI